MDLPEPVPELAEAQLARPVMRTLGGLRALGTYDTSALGGLLDGRSLESRSSAFATHTLRTPCWSTGDPVRAPKHLDEAQY
jgi:hypothetical protein